MKKFEYTSYFVVPGHLSHKISQENWNWINEFSEKLYLTQPSGVIKYEFWEIRGYWFITYFLNPSQDNFDHMSKVLREYEILKDNLRYLEFVEDIKTRVRNR